MHVETEVGGQINNGILTNVGPRLRTTGATRCELDGGTGNAGSDIDGVVREDDKGDDEQAGILTEPMRVLESTSRRRNSEVVTFVRNNEIFCLWVSVSVDGDDGGDGYSPLRDFELKLGGGDDSYLENDKN